MRSKVEGDDDGDSEAGGDRRERKNTREKQRRMEVNEKFEQLVSLLGLEHRAKSNKVGVLCEAIERIQVRLLLVAARRTCAAACSLAPYAARPHACSYARSDWSG